MIFNEVFFQILYILKFFITTQTLHYGCDQAEIVYFELEARKYNLPAGKCTRTSRQPRRKLHRYQRGNILNRFEFTYAGRDLMNTVINRLDASVPKLVKQTSDEVNKLAQARI